MTVRAQVNASRKAQIVRLVEPRLREHEVRRPARRRTRRPPPQQRQAERAADRQLEAQLNTVLQLSRRRHKRSRSSKR